MNNSMPINLITWKQASLSFGTKQVLNDVSCAIPGGLVTCVCGGNGAGKTQLIKSAIKLVSLSKGSIDYHPSLLSGAGYKIGYVPQQKLFNRDFPATVFDFLASVRNGHWPLLKRSQLADFSSDALEKFGVLHLGNKSLADLSGGELQRVFLARAYAMSPELYILDEPFAALDRAGKDDLLERLRSLSQETRKGILLVTHSERVVSELADFVAVLERGRLIAFKSRQEILEDRSLHGVAFAGHDHVHHVEVGDES